MILKESSALKSRVVTTEGVCSLLLGRGSRQGKCYWVSWNPSPSFLCSRVPRALDGGGRVCLLRCLPQSQLVDPRFDRRESWEDEGVEDGCCAWTGARLPTPPLGPSSWRARKVPPVSRRAPWRLPHLGDGHRTLTLPQRRPGVMHPPACPLPEGPAHPPRQGHSPTEAALGTRPSLAFLVPDLLKANLR